MPVLKTKTTATDAPGNWTFKRVINARGRRLPGETGASRPNVGRVQRQNRQRDHGRFHLFEYRNTIGHKYPVFFL